MDQVNLFDRYPTLRQVIVNTKSDRAFRGILWRKARGYLVLRDAEILKAKGETTPESGGVHLISSAGGDPRPLTFPRPPAYDGSPAFSADGRALAYASCAGDESVPACDV